MTVYHAPAPLLNRKSRGNAAGSSDSFCAALSVSELPVHAARSAAWFWREHDLNWFADGEDFDGLSDVINRGRKTARIGDANGYADRLNFYTRAKEVLL